MSRTSARVKWQSVFCVILNMTDAIVITPKMLQAACHSAFLLSAAHSYAATIVVTHAVPSSGQRPNTGTLQRSCSHSSRSRKTVCDDVSLAPALQFYKDRCFVEVLSRKNSAGQARLCASIRENRSVTTDLGCHRARLSGVCPGAGECGQRRGRQTFRRLGCTSTNMRRTHIRPTSDSRTSPGVP